MTCFLHPSEALYYRYYWDQIWLCMITFSTSQSKFLSFSLIGITIVRLQHSSFIDIWVNFWEFQDDMLPALQWKHQHEIPPEVEVVLYDHLQHLIIHVHISFSFQYNHCEAITQLLLWHLRFFLRLSIWHASSTPINHSIWDDTDTGLWAVHDHLQYCTIQFHIIFSFQYNHCETTAEQPPWYLRYFLRISIWYASSSPVKPSIIDTTETEFGCAWSSSTLLNLFSYHFLISV